MINVSSEFRKLMNERTDFKQYAEMTLADGTEIVLTKDDFSVDNNSVVDGAGESGIPLGVAICRHIQIEIDNRDDRYSEIDFFDSKIRLYMTFELSETEEKIEYGTFTVRDPETYGDTIIITALDDMYKANKAYSTNLIFPATLKAMLVDACETLGIPLGTTSFLNDNFKVSEKPTDITFRQLFGYISQIAAGNIRIDTTGRLRVLTYDFSIMEDIQKRIDGGDYLKWSNPVSLDGGNFTDYSSGDSVDGGEFEVLTDYHILANWKDGLQVDTDDVVITGISTTVENEEGEEQKLIYGVDGYVLKIENPLISGHEQAALELIGSVIVGGKMRKFSGDLVANPTCEFMDVAAVVDRKGNVYATILTDINFQFFGFTTISNSAESAMRNSSQTYSAAVETLVAAKKLVQKEKTAREKAVEQLANDLKTSSGLFMTEEKQPDGSTIYYMHDKATLKESLIVWKLTALAFGISTDGGKTYPYGFTVNGEVITRLLYAEGINADYINTGAIKVTDESNNTIFSADYDTKQVYINASAVKIGTKAITDELVEMAATISLVDDKVELKASKGELSSLISVESGKIEIKSNRFSWDSTYSSLSADGKLTAKDVDLTGKITAESGKIANFTIAENAFYSGSKSSITARESGVYIGTDGISVGYGSSNPAFKVTANGDVTIGTACDLNIGGDINFTTALSYIQYEGSNRIGINEDYIGMYKELRVLPTSGSGSSLIVSNTTISRSTSKIYFKDSDIEIECSGSNKLKGNSIICNSILDKLGFWGNSGSTKKTVAKISTTSTATAADAAKKINDLIDALKAYNLIG